MNAIGAAKLVSITRSRLSHWTSTPWKYPTNPEDVEKQRVINRIADILETGATEYDCFVVVAPPDRLGLLRWALSVDAKRRVKDELRKELTHVPNGDLPAPLATLVAT